MRAILRHARAIGFAVLILLCCAAMAAAYAEEPLMFRDPYTGETTDDEISTLHDDLTYVLALAAGFSVADSVRLQIANQLVDSEQLGPGEAVSYTNCLGAFDAPPDPDVVCQGVIHVNLIWPRWDDMKDQETCVTSRFGPYSPFFHFPHNNAQELGALHDWAWGLTSTLHGYEAYAWGRPTDISVVMATCAYTRPVTIQIGVEAGSLEAFGVYLHSLADYYSHRECIAAMDALGMPWATHTLTGCPPCDYNPYSPQADDVHGREFGSYPDALRTDEAIQHVYRELSARSVQGEGLYSPLSMSAPISGAQTLSETLAIYVHEWDFDHPAERRAWLDALAPQIIAQRAAQDRLLIPLLLKRGWNDG